MVLGSFFFPNKGISAINLPWRTALEVTHIFWYTVFLFLFSSKFFQFTFYFSFFYGYLEVSYLPNVFGFSGDLSNLIPFWLKTILCGRWLRAEYKKSL